MLLLPTPHVAAAATQEKDTHFLPPSFLPSSLIFLYAIMSSVLCFLTRPLPFLHTQKCPQHGFWVFLFLLTMVHRNQGICSQNLCSPHPAVHGSSADPWASWFMNKADIFPHCYFKSMMVSSGVPGGHHFQREVFDTCLFILQGVGNVCSGSEGGLSTEPSLGDFFILF